MKRPWLAALMAAAMLGAGAAWGGQQGGSFADGWRWYKHRLSGRAPEAELLDILKTLRTKYGESGLDMREVDQEIRRYTKNYSVPRRGASAQAAFDDGWKWYQYRKAQGAERKELADILQTLKAKYSGLGVDLAGVEAELARYGAATPAPKPRTQAAVPAAAPALPVAPAGGLVEPVKPAAKKFAAPPKGQPAELAVDREARFQRRLAELKSPDPNVRVRAAKELKELKDPRSVGDLVLSLSDTDRFVSIVAANALVGIGEPSLSALLRATEQEDPNVRLLACVALGDLRHPSAVPALEKCSKDKVGDVRQAAKNALNKVNSKGALNRWQEDGK